MLAMAGPRLPRHAAHLLAAGALLSSGVALSACQAVPESADAGGGRDAGGADRALDAAADAPAIPPGLIAWYDFDQGGGTVALDSSGNYNNAGLVGQVAWGAAGHATGDVTFSGGYVLLPPGVLDQAQAFSFAAWVKLRTDRVWQRIMDFGSGTNLYMFLTPHSDGDTFRFAISRAGAGAEQRLDGPAALPINVWKHVAVVLTGTSGTLYLDGAPLMTADVTLRPSDIAPLANQWLGRSEFPDPSFDGEIDQVRVYDRALSPAEVLALFGQP